MSTTFASPGADPAPDSAEDVPEKPDDDRGRVPTLQDCCMATVYRCLNARSVLELLEFCRITGGMFAQGPELKGKCMQFLVNTFETVRQVMGEEAVGHVLPEEVIERLKEAERERAECIRRVRIEGKVVERMPAGTPVAKIVSSDGSVAGKRVHTWETLRAGLEWPPDVDPTCREEYLSEEEFRRLFRCSFPEYRALPDWKQLQLRKDNDLF